MDKFSLYCTIGAVILIQIAFFWLFRYDHYTRKLSADYLKSNRLFVVLVATQRQQLQLEPASYGQQQQQQQQQQHQEYGRVSGSNYSGVNAATHDRSASAPPASLIEMVRGQLERSAANFKVLTILLTPPPSAGTEQGARANGRPQIIEGAAGELVLHLSSDEAMNYYHLERVVDCIETQLTSRHWPAARHNNGARKQQRASLERANSGQNPDSQPSSQSSSDSDSNSERRADKRGAKLYAYIDLQELASRAQTGGLPSPTPLPTPRPPSGPLVSAAPSAPVAAVASAAPTPPEAAHLQTTAISWPLEQLRNYSITSYALLFALQRRVARDGTRLVFVRDRRHRKSIGAAPLCGEDLHGQLFEQLNDSAQSLVDRSELFQSSPAPIQVELRSRGSSSRKSSRGRAGGIRAQMGAAFRAGLSFVTQLWNEESTDANQDPKSKPMTRRISGRRTDSGAAEGTVEMATSSSQNGSSRDTTRILANSNGELIDEKLVAEYELIARKIADLLELEHPRGLSVFV